MIKTLASVSIASCAALLVGCSSSELSTSEKNEAAMAKTCEGKARAEVHMETDPTFGDIQIEPAETFSAGRTSQFDVTFTHKSESWVEYKDASGSSVHREFLCATKMNSSGGVDSLWTWKS